MDTTDSTKTEKLIPWGERAYKTADQAYMVSFEVGRYWSGHAKLGGGPVKYIAWTIYDCRTACKAVKECSSLKEACAALAKIRGVGRISLPRQSKKTVTP